MATFTFRGDAMDKQQEGTFQITAYDAATTYAIIISNKTVSILGDTDVNTTASSLATACSESEFPEFQEIEWSSATDTITAQAKTAGKSFTATSSETGGTGTIGNYTAVVANSGKGDVSQANNYYNVGAATTGALPGNGDTLIFENVADVNLNEGLTALSGIALAQVIFRNWGGDVGLPQHTGSYWEYRQTYLQLDADEVIFDCPECQLARIDSLAAQTSLKVFATGSSKVSNLETLCWKGTHASNVAQFDGGSIGVAVLAGEVATILTLNQGYVTQPESDSRVRCGTGVTLTTITRIGGTMEINSAATTINSREGAGLLTIRTSGTITTLNVYAGGVDHLSSGTITTLILGREQLFNAARNEVGFTITNQVQMNYKSSFIDPSKRCTMSAGYKPMGCRNEDITMNRGTDTSNTTT